MVDAVAKLTDPPYEAEPTLDVSAVLALFDRFAPPRRRTLTISVVAPDPAGVRDAVRAAFPHARAVDVRKEDGAGRASFAIAAGDDEDALSILEALQKFGVPDVKVVRIEED